MKPKKDKIEFEITAWDKIRALFYMSLGLIGAVLYLIGCVFYVAFCYVYHLFRAIYLGSKYTYNYWLYMGNRRGKEIEE